MPESEGDCLPHSSEFTGGGPVSFCTCALPCLLQKFLPEIPLNEDPALAEGVPEFPEPPSATFQPTNLEVDVGRNRINSAFQKYFFRPPSPKIAPSYDSEYDVYDVVVCHGTSVVIPLSQILGIPNSR